MFYRSPCAPGSPGSANDRCGSSARDSTNWVTARLMMTNARGVTAAATAAGLGQFPWRPHGVRAGLARGARFVQEPVTQGVSSFTGGSAAHRLGLARFVPQARRMRTSARAPTASAGQPRVLALGWCQTPITQLEGDARHGKVAEDTQDRCGPGPAAHWRAGVHPGHCRSGGDHGGGDGRVYERSDGQGGPTPSRQQFAQHLLSTQAAQVMTAPAQAAAAGHRRLQR